MNYQTVCTNTKQIIIKTASLQLQQDRHYCYNIINSEGIIKKWYSDNAYYSYILNPPLVVFKEYDTIMDGNCIRVQAIYRGDVFCNYLSISFNRDLFIIS